MEQTARTTALRDALIIDDLDRRTHDRVTELADGLLALRHYADSPLVRNAREQCANARLRPDDIEVITDAAIVASALHRPAAIATGDADPPHIASGSGDPERELRHFLLVAWAYRHSPIIRRSLRETSEPGAPPPTLPHPRGAR